MSEDIVGRGRLEPTQPPPGESFEVDCDIRFSSTVQGDSRGFPPSVDTRCDRCVVRRMDSQPIPGLLPHIPILNFTYKPLDARFHLCLCRFECDEDGLEVETQWVRARTSHFSYRSTVR